jgi:hypothetical protein
MTASLSKLQIKSEHIIALTTLWKVLRVSLICEIWEQVER